MPVFVRTVTSNPVVMRQGMPFKSGAWEGFYSVFNVPTLNYNLACSNFEGEVDKTPAELLSEYAFGGVLVTTRGCEFSEQPQTASVVVGIKGPERVFNIWGAQLEANTPLYFIIKVCSFPWVVDECHLCCLLVGVVCLEVVAVCAEELALCYLLKECGVDVD